MENVLARAGALVTDPLPALPGHPVNVRPTMRARLRAAAREIVHPISGRMRGLPTFLIIGAQKAGTSSIWHQLASHPGVACPPVKEIDYFNWFFDRPLTWYRSFFPVGSRRRSGEASPDYLYDPRVPSRVREVLPEARLIVLLRDPVTRAISHYHHERNRGFERLPCLAAMQAEAERLGGERARVMREPTYRSMAMRHFSYIDRGRYADQLEAWFACFPREQVLVLSAEALASAPADTYKEVREFLGLGKPVSVDFRPHNVGSYVDIDEEARQWLAGQFQVPNQRLFSLLGKSYDWTGS